MLFSFGIMIFLDGRARVVGSWFSFGEMLGLWDISRGF